MNQSRFQLFLLFLYSRCGARDIGRDPTNDEKTQAKN